MTLNRLLSILGSVIALLLSVLIGLGAWNLNATRQSLEMLARMEERVVAQDTRTNDLRLRLAAVEARMLAAEIRLVELRQKGATE